MVRRSTVDRIPQPPAHSSGYAADTGDLPQGSERGRYQAGPGWRGAGGRWLVWVFRGVFWLVLLVIGYRGITAIVLNETPSGSSAAVPPAKTLSFPVTQASGFAWQFGQVYLNASSATSSARGSELAQFLAPGVDTQLGWDGAGTLQLQSESVAGVRVINAHKAIVRLLARVNGNLMELGVPIYTANGAMVVSGEPAWLPAPPRVNPPVPAAPTADLATQATMNSQLPLFFAAYASGDQATLGRYLAPGATMTGLGGAVTFGSLTSVTVPQGGTTRHIIATVVWRVPSMPAATGRRASVTPPPPAGIEMTYALTIVERNGTWYVEDITPSSEVSGTP